jgi:hypothetical protein
MRTLAQRERRLRRARIATRIEIAIGSLAVSVPLLWYLVGPTTLSGGMTYRVPAWRPPLELIAFAGIVVGFIWMLRIRFTGPEDGARSNWRSH